MKKKIVKTTYLYFLAIFLFALLFTVTANLILPIFIGERFEDSSQFIIYIALAFSFQGMYFMVTNYIFYEKCTHLLAYVSFITGILHVSLAYVLVTANGAIGAAQAALISYFVTFIATWILSNKVYKMPWLFRR